jgi:hypothetical protein
MKNLTWNPVVNNGHHKSSQEAHAQSIQHGQGCFPWTKNRQSYELRITVFNPGQFLATWNQNLLKRYVKIQQITCSIKILNSFEQQKKDNFFKSYNISKKRCLKKKHKFCVRKLLASVRPRRISRKKIVDPEKPWIRRHSAKKPGSAIMHADLEHWLPEALLLNKIYPDQLTSFRVQLRREVILGIPQL